MSPARVWVLLRKDLALGPRSPVFLYALVFPLLATMVIQLAFGTLFAPKPRLGIVDQDHSAIALEASKLTDIQVTMLGSTDELRREVEANDLDAGLTLPAGFDQALITGQRPPLEFFVGGQSLASSRIVLAVTVAGLVRQVVGAAGDIAVTVDDVGGGPAVPVSDRLIPLLVMFAVLIAGLFVPASGLVEEKERGTLSALLVTPAGIGEVLLAKGSLGTVLALAAGVITLALNGVIGQHTAALVLILVIADWMAVEIGLVVGSLARSTNALYSVIKAGNVVLMGPVIFFIWPDLPSWVAKLFPTYYFLNPLYQVAINDAALADVWRQLSVAVAICVLLVPAVALAGRRMAERLAAT